MIHKTLYNPNGEGHIYDEGGYLRAVYVESRTGREYVDGANIVNNSQNMILAENVLRGMMGLPLVAEGGSSE